MNYSTSPAFTLTTSHKKNILQMVDQDYASPGPKYNPMSSTDYGKTTGCTIGNSKRTTINHWIEQTPSPNQYNPQKTVKQHAVSIPKYKPLPKSNTTPDCGWYNPNSKLIRPKTAQYTMGARYGSIMDQIKPYPGPAQYETNKQTLDRCKSAKGIGFTTSKRFSEPNNNPGVGNYKIADQRGMVNNKGSIGRGNRQALTKPNYPSPNAYLKVSCFDDGIQRKLGKSMSTKLKSCFQNKSETAEAFLKYKVNSEAVGRSNEKFTIPKSKRKVFEVEQKPGPADYMTQQVNLKNTFTAPFYMQKYEEHNQIAQFPGPALYEVRSQSTAPKFTIARAKSASRFQDHPGVGRYNIDVGGDRKANMFGRSQRTNFISKNIAGVGDYKIEQKPKYKGTIGKSQRFKKEQKMPGPGDYQIHSIIGFKSKHL